MNGIFTTRDTKKGLLIPYTGIFKGNLSDDQECPYCMTVEGGAVDSEDLKRDYMHLAGYVNESDPNQKYNCTFVQIPYRGPMPEYSHFKSYGGLYMFLLVAVDIPAGAELLASYGTEHTNKGYAVRENPPSWRSLLYKLQQCESIQ